MSNRRNVFLLCTAVLAVLLFVAVGTAGAGMMIDPNFRVNAYWCNTDGLDGCDAVAQIGLNATTHGLLVFENGTTVVPSGWDLLVFDAGAKPPGWDPNTTFLAGYQPCGVFGADGSGSYAFSIGNAIQGDMDETPTVDEGATIGTFLMLAGRRISDNAFFAAGFTNGDMLSQGFHQAINEKGDVIIDRTKPIVHETPYVGDANTDGCVDGGDLTIVGGNWMGTEKVWADGDFNDDSFVDGGDLSLMGGSWSWVKPAPVPGMQTVPEPATLALLVSGGFLLMRRRR